MRFCITVFTALVPVTATGAASSPPEPKLQTIDAIVADAMTTFHAPGTAVVVVRRDQTLILKGYGRRAIDSPAPVTPDTLFPLASCTKQFTTALLAMLVDTGDLDWDTQVQKLYPEFKLSDPHANQLLTLRDLLCHRTGLGSHDLLWYRAPWNIDHILKQVPKLPLDYPFRSGYRYNSITFMAAGKIAEKAGKAPWNKLMKERLCDPLEMKGVKFTTTEIPANADRAWGHQINKAGQIERIPVYELKEPNPSGSMHATPRDLAQWLQFQVTEGLAPTGQRLVSVQPLLETRTPQNLIKMDPGTQKAFPETVQASYAMGWVVTDYRGMKVVGHGGLYDGFRVQITLVPDNALGFAVLTNLHDSRLPMALTYTLIDLYCGLNSKNWNDYYKKLSDDVAAARKAALAARDKGRNPNAPPSLKFADYVGKYEHPAYGTATVTLTDGQLVAAFSGFKFPLQHYEQDTFRITDGLFEDELATFLVKHGQPQTVTLAGIAFQRP